jgi:flagellar motility protein MotE (MotC chaperone)
MTVSEIISMIAVAVSIGTLTIAWRKLKPQLRQVSSDTASKFQEIADRAAEKIQRMQEQVDQCENKIDALESQLRSANERSARFENWAKRLAAQVVSLGAIPVELDPTRPTRSEAS